MLLASCCGKKERIDSENHFLNVGLDRHCHCQNCSVIAPSACLLESIVGPLHLHRPHLQALSYAERLQTHNFKQSHNRFEWVSRPCKQIATSMMMLPMTKMDMDASLSNFLCYSQWYSWECTDMRLCKQMTLRSCAPGCYTI